MNILKLQAKYGLESEAEATTEVTDQYEGDVEATGEADDQVGVVDLDAGVSALNATGITSGLDQADRAVEDELSATDDVQNAMVAVEAYLNLLEDRESRNLALTNDVTTAMRIGLESIDANFFSDVSISLENQVAIRNGEPEGDGELDDDVDDRASKAKGINDKLKSKWATLWEALKRVFNRVLNAATEFYNNMKNNTAKLLERINELAKEATTLEGGVDFKIRGAERLMIDGKFVGDKAEAYKTIEKNADIILGKIPTEGLKILKEWNAKGSTNPYFASHSVNKAAEQSFKTMEEFIRFASRAFGDFTEVKDSDSVPNGFESDKAHKTWRSDTMMGDRVYYGGMGTEEVMRTQRKFLLVEFTSLAESSPASSLSNVDLKTFTSMQALSALKGCKVLLGIVDDYKTEREAFTKEVQRLGGEEMGNILGGNPNIKETFDARMASMNFGQSLTKNNWRFTGYIITIAKTLTVLVTAMLEAERGDTVDAETA